MARTKHTTRTLRKTTGRKIPRQQHRATKTKVARTTSTGTIVTVGVLFLLLQQWGQIQRNSGTFHDVSKNWNALSFGGGEIIMTTIEDHKETQIEAYGGEGEDNQQQQQQQQRRLYYIHVGKTGGSTMDKVLRSNCEWYRSLAPKKKCFRELSSSSSQATAEGGGGEEEESVLSKATTRTLHLNVRNKIEGKFIRDNNITSFLWTLRNPISRAVSAFNMDHPDNSKVSGYQGYWGYWRGMFYRDCGFRTVQDFADILRLLPLQQQQQQQQDGGGTPTRTVFRNVTGFQSNKTDVVNCRELAEKVIAGQAHVLINSHLSSNYATYAAATIQPFPHKEILVVRTEELWNDVANLDHLLSVSSWSGNQSHSYGDSSNSSSGRKNSVQAVIATAASRNTNSNTTTTTSTSASIQKNAMANYRHSHGSESYKVKSDLTAQGKAVLCCFLSNENQIYEDLMRRAINLSWEEKNKYVNMLYNDCRIGSNTSQILHNNNGSSNSNGDDNQSFNWVDWRSAGCPTIN